MKRSKRYTTLAGTYDKQELVDVTNAVKQIKAFENAKIDEAVEMHFRLGVDGRHADQQVRGAMVLPHGTGKSKKVLVFAKGQKAEEAKEAGQGTGLGLSISYDIITTSHGGMLLVNSEVVIGTTFTIKLPNITERIE